MNSFSLQRFYWQNFQFHLNSSKYTVKVKKQKSSLIQQCTKCRLFFISGPLNIFVGGATRVKNYALRSYWSACHLVVKFWTKMWTYLFLRCNLLCNHNQMQIQRRNQVLEIHVAKNQMIKTFSKKHYKLFNIKLQMIRYQ